MEPLLDRTGEGRRHSDPVFSRYSLECIGRSQIVLISKSSKYIIELSRSNRDFFFQQLMWIGIYVVISLAISFTVPFPYSLPILIGVIILLSFYVRRRLLKRMGMTGTSMFGGYGSGNSIRYYCMNCGTKHNQIACPKCGSKMKRAS